MGACLDVRDLSVKAGKFLLQEISFSAPASKITAIMGPNGSGKTTLLKTVSGALKPLTGSVRLDGNDIHAMKHRARARQVAMVAQESALHFPMSVLEYCLLARHPFLEGLELASREDLEIVRWALQVTQSIPFEKRWMNELSGGERQRVILARALAQEPRLLLLDEPTLNLDVAFQMELLQLVERLAQDREMTVLIVTHELNLASEFAQQILLLQSGFPRAYGPPAEVITADRLRGLFNSELIIDQNPVSGAKRITLLRKN